jgi:hypothetical protein
MTIAAAQGDVEAQRALEAHLAAVPEEGTTLAERIRRIVAGERGANLLEGLDPQPGALVYSILRQL